MPKVVFSDVSKNYKVKQKTINALRNVNFSIEKNDFVVLSGASGSGKSTILQLLSGIERPTSGKIMIDEQDITAMSNSELSKTRRQKIGIIFQQFYLEPNLTLRQNIELPAMFLNINKKAREQRTNELVKTMNLVGYLDHLPSELSGGQIQRAAIARAIYSNPDILIADEPTSNLDPENFYAVVKLMLQIRSDYGTTLVVATHDQNLAKFANKIIRINNGSITL